MTDDDVPQVPIDQIGYWKWEIFDGSTVKWTGYWVALGDPSMPSDWRGFHVHYWPSGSHTGLEQGSKLVLTLEEMGDVDDATVASNVANLLSGSLERVGIDTVEPDWKSASIPSPANDLFALKDVSGGDSSYNYADYYDKVGVSFRTTTPKKPPYWYVESNTTVSIVGGTTSQWPPLVVGMTATFEPATWDDPGSPGSSWYWTQATEL
ncbi:MAG: hypothetical protein ACFCGT_13560 [Sandaracinaceae bacterium]